MKKLRTSLLCIFLFHFLVPSLIASPRGKSYVKNPKGYSFGVRTTGKGSPMILIPGFRGSADTYDEIVAHYKTRFKCYVITPAGFAGQPGLVGNDHPLRVQRDEIIQFILDNRLQKPILVGFSFGGSLALWIASTRPDLIGALIELDGVPFDAAVENPNVNTDSIKNVAEKRRLKIVSKNAAYWVKIDSTRHTAKYRNDGIDELKKLVTDSLRINQILDWDDLSDYKTSGLMDAEQEGLDLRDSVRKIKSPILVLGSWMGWDNIKTKEQAEARYRNQYTLAKDLTLAFSANGKHFLMYEDFNWMIAQMDRFLKQHRKKNS